MDYIVKQSFGFAFVLFSMQIKKQPEKYQTNKGRHIISHDQ